MTLSEENKNKLLLDYGVYKYVNSDGKKLDYWCQNWIFIPKQYGDKIYMVDTFYFDLSSSSFELTNNNFNQFEFIFDKREVRKTDYYEAARYNEKDILKTINFGLSAIFIIDTNIVSIYDLINLSDKKVKSIELYFTDVPEVEIELEDK